MNEQNFERELPKNYRLVKTIDAKNIKLGIIFNVLAIVIFFAVFIIAFIPMIINTEKLEVLTGIEVFLGIIGTFVYMVLHELVHGIAYKIKTGVNLTFGISWSCAFCGVPKIFTYRKPALFAVLAPLVVFTVIFIPLLIVTYFYNPSLYLTLLFIFGMHLGGSTGDAYVVILLLTKYKDDTTLMNDTGPKMTFFIRDDLNSDYDEKTKEFIEEFNAEKENAPIDEKALATKSKALSIVCIVLFSLFLIFHSLITFSKNGMLYPFDELKFYESMSFYICLFSVAVIVISSATMKKFYKTKLAIIILLALLGLPLTLISAMQSSFDAKSHTTDVNNYGIYDSEYMMIEHFPENITDNMTPIYYSYYYDNSWDYCYELYLEVEITDNEYENFKTQYEDGLKNCFFASDYKEYVFFDNPQNYINEDGSYYMNSPNIRKIIFNDKDKTVIFVSICGIDPFYYENSYYFKRFNINPIEYSNYLKENKNESN